ncbi:hypothetical protein GUJ93_ZPchr0006g43079 [Zizania palustris]|uniref:Uncharacterized protein n=1 Tax=Zizania palustris TaxID=103762 RepID=A0A8J5VSD9_ZIZPA|nr:hypothetical protein GUJ93_ZPchr0006g43079 [Zizania palustris]
MRREMRRGKNGESSLGKESSPGLSLEHARSEVLARAAAEEDRVYGIPLVRVPALASSPVRPRLIPCARTAGDEVSRGDTAGLLRPASISVRTESNRREVLVMLHMHW